MQIREARRRLREAQREFKVLAMDLAERRGVSMKTVYLIAQGESGLNPSPERP